MIPTFEQWIKSEPILYNLVYFTSSYELRLNNLYYAISLYVSDYIEYEIDRLNEKYTN